MALNSTLCLRFVMINSFMWNSLFRNPHFWRWQNKYSKSEMGWNFLVGCDHKQSKEKTPVCCFPGIYITHLYVNTSRGASLVFYYAKVRKMAEECAACSSHTAVVLWRKRCMWALPPKVVPFTLTLCWKEQTAVILDSLFFSKMNERKKMLRCNLYLALHNNCVTIKCTPQWNFINALSHISGLSFTLTAPCVWLNLTVSEFTWWRLSPGFIYTQWPGSSIWQCSHLLLQVATLQSWSGGVSLRKYKTWRCRSHRFV